MTPQYNTFSKCMMTILLMSIVGGCSTLGPTQPNVPFQGPYPKSFKSIQEKNSLLAIEIGKLPEIQDGIL